MRRYGFLFTFWQRVSGRIQLPIMKIIPRSLKVNCNNPRVLWNIFFVSETTIDLKIEIFSLQWSAVWFFIYFFSESLSDFQNQFYDFLCENDRILILFMIPRTVRPDSFQQCNFNNCRLIGAGLISGPKFFSRQRLKVRSLGLPFPKAILTFHTALCPSFSWWN